MKIATHHEFWRYIYIYIYVVALTRCVCVRVCVRERERQTQTQTERQTDRDNQSTATLVRTTFREHKQFTRKSEWRSFAMALKTASPRIAVDWLELYIKNKSIYFVGVASFPSLFICIRR